MTNRIDVTGQKFGRLTALDSHLERVYGHSTAMWRCACECGGSVTASTGRLRAGCVRSCGCLQRERAAEVKTTHGQSGTRIYSTWKNMLSRCRNPKSSVFRHYGGRGIRVCDRWSSSFASFRDDMGDPPSSSHSIDRYPNKNGDYEPGNCRWATDAEQANNTRANRIIEHRGETLTAAEWSRSLGFSTKLIRDRIDRLGWSIEKALTTPPRKW